MKGARRRWVVRSAGPSLVVIALAVTILGRAVELERAASAYAAAVGEPERAAGAVQAYRSLQWPVWFDEEAPLLGEGAASLLAGDLNGARSAFESVVAHGDGERRCRAIVNVVLTIEAQGDEVVAIDGGAASLHYEEARRTVDLDPGCRQRRHADGTGAGDRLDRAAARLDDKLAALPPSAASDELRPVTPEESDSDFDPADLNELDRALEENADTRSRGRELDESTEPAGIPRDPQW